MSSHLSACVGQQVSLGGIVATTDPVVVEINHGLDETRYVPLEAVDEPVSQDTQIGAYDTLTNESTTAVERDLV
jgi:hypothetical protein